MRSVVEILVPSKWQFPYAYRLYFRGRSSKMCKTINHESPIHCKHGNIQLFVSVRHFDAKISTPVYKKICVYDSLVIV